ncbi:hypothetical protein JQ597_07270 [Bradyrhizobium sp. AUGA SZCCT0177]|uniref:hypothetical protein n=1 Tax=Bradyrhizobium sp. AUGA SZCCT0177 TaxID=2807665 RepID=UPI001BA91F93|nr:hypothetical protein [Bradyrhizobium sp. AUGA SZCCT0177]MBR1281833.1 hypothetical protein [Bradyrhizobium sp. AUGA SZCCT0177]
MTSADRREWRCACAIVVLQFVPLIVPTASAPTPLAKAGCGHQDDRGRQRSHARLRRCVRSQKSPEAEAATMVLQSCVSMHIAKTGAAGPDILLADRYTNYAPREQGSHEWIAREARRETLARVATGTPLLS